MSLCALRFLGFVPDDIASVPDEALVFVAGQVDAAPHELLAYGARAQTRSDHVQLTMAHLDWRRADDRERERLAIWLSERAVEHDSPAALNDLAGEHLRARRVLRPPVDTLTRMIATARADAHRRIDHLLADLAGSLDQGTVTASLLVARLHAQQRRSVLAAALQDYGRLVKTEFVLRYLTRPVERRGIHRQLNKGESINALEDAVFYGNEGRIRLQTVDRQSTQAAALALVSAAIVTWNTHHMNQIVERERAAGRLLDDVDLARLSPAIHAHINLNGRYHIHPDQPPRHLTPGRDTLATYR